MAVASEFEFSRVLGIEIAPKLAATARRNAAAIRQRYPNRTSIEIIEGDATQAQIPDGDVVVFLYNPFGRVLFERFIWRLMAISEHREVFVVYEGPANGDVLDAIAGFRRWYAEVVPCEPSERGYVLGDREVVITWRWGGDPSQLPWPGADARIVRLGDRLELEPTGPADSLP